MKRRTAGAALPNIAFCGISLGGSPRVTRAHRQNDMGRHSTWSMGVRVDTEMGCFDSERERNNAALTGFQDLLVGKTAVDVSSPGPILDV